jgi:ABC-2 type transport system permease protein
MLWYKAWCETRARVVIAVVAIAAATALVWQTDWRTRGHGMGFAAYVWTAAANDSLKTLFVLLAIVLGGGSLRQEHALGTAGFTLALPVRRRQLIIARAGTGLVELIALAGLIAGALAVLSWTAGDTGSPWQSLRFAVQWSVCGGAVLSLSLLMSIAIANPYAGWLVSLLGFLGYEAIVGVSGLRRYPACDLYRLMSEPRAPWPALIAVTAATAGLVAIGHGYLHARVYATVGQGLFVVLAVLLGLGGTRRERAHGSLGFTLALPAPRAAHAAVRAAVGLAEVIALAAIPAVVVPVCSAAIGEHYGAGQAATFALLWAAIGSAVFAASFAVSIVVANDYAALAVAVLTVRFAPPILARLPGLHRLPPIQDLLSGRGMAYFDPRHAQLTCEPWGVVAAAAIATAAVLIGCVRLTRRDRFL